MLTFDEAKQALLQRAKAIVESESVSLLDAAGRVLAHQVTSTLNVPPHDNSAMDGYAVCVAECVGSLPVSQRIPAGVAPDPLLAQSVARIFTGAPIPAGADAVVMQEQAQVAEDGLVSFTVAPVVGQNIRRAGEDIHAGQCVLEQGRYLSAADIGLAASMGLTRLDVLRKLKVAAFFTGDELVEPGRELGSGQIYNSNRYWLIPLLQRLGCQVTDLGIIPDSLEVTRATLQAAAGSVDLIITCGGVSVGEEDHVKTAVQQEGELDLWKIAIKPGKPLAAGKVGQADFIGLPGNPVSGFVTFMLLVKPFLQLRAGLPAVAHAMKYQSGFDWLKPDSRRDEFVRVRRQLIERGTELVLFPHQGSGVLLSCAWADGVVRVPAGRQVHRGDWLEWIPFEG